MRLVGHSRSTGLRRGVRSILNFGHRNSILLIGVLQRLTCLILAAPRSQTVSYTMSGPSYYTILVWLALALPLVPAVPVAQFVGMFRSIGTGYSVNTNTIVINTPPDYSFVNFSQPAEASNVFVNNQGNNVQGLLQATITSPTPDPLFSRSVIISRVEKDGSNYEVRLFLFESGNHLKRTSEFLSPILCSPYSL